MRIYIIFTKHPVLPRKSVAPGGIWTHASHIGCFAPSKAKRPTFSWAPLPSTKTTATTMAISTQIATSNPQASMSCKSCEKWGAPCPCCVCPAPPSSPLESEWSDEDWNGDRHNKREEKKREQLEKE